MSESEIHRVVRDSILGPPVRSDWRDRILMLWKEDECLRHDETAPHVEEMWEQFTGRQHVDPTPIAEVDDGDWGAKLYRGGWVKTWAHDGGGIGVVVTLRTRRAE